MGGVVDFLNALFLCHRKLSFGKLHCQSLPPSDTSEAFPFTIADT